MKKLLLKNWRDIKTRKGQFAALIILVALGITSYVAFVSSYKNLTASADRASEELMLADFASRVVSAPAAVIDEIRALPGVASAEGRLVIDTGLDVDGETQATARLIGIPADRHPDVNDIIVEEGSYIESGAANTGILQKKFAKDADVGVGDELTIRIDGAREQVAVVGVGSSADYVWPIRAKGELPAPKEFAVIFMAQEEVERLFGREPVYNDFSVLVSEGADIEAVIADVEQVLEPYQLEETVRQADLPSNFALREEVRQNQSVAYSMPLLILVISSLSLFIALSRLVQSQRGQIGLAKALGYSDAKIIFHYLLFSLIIALAGAAAGFALGQFLGREITAMYNDFLNIPFLEHQVYPSVVFWAFAISGIACVFAGIFPAWASLRMNPANAMREDPNLVISKGKVPLIERLLAPVIPKSFTVRIPLRNIFRTRKRSIYTVIGIVFALVLTISTWSLFDSVDYLIDTKFNQAERWDISAVFSEDVTGERIDDIAAWEGVERVEEAQMIPSRIEGPGASHEGIVTAVAPDADFHGFDIVEGDEAGAALAAGGLILPRVIAEKLDVEVGDAVLVRTPYLREGGRVTLRSISEEAWGAAIYTSADQGAALTAGAAGGSALYLNVASDREDEVRARLFALPGVETVVVKSKLVGAIESQMGFLYLFGGILLAFAFAMAFIVIYNTFTANILERVREIATMRTIGEDQRHLGAMITLENLFLALLGIPLGIVFGLWAASALYGSLSTEAYTFKAVLYPTSYVWIILSILAVLLISEIPPIRRVFRLDLAEATKFVE